MNPARRIGLELLRARRAAGLTQAALAARIGTTQSAVARAEAGRVVPRYSYVDRVARATGRAITIVAGKSRPVDRRARVRRALGDFRFDPWSRNPSPAEARALEAEGLTRERIARS